MPNEENLAGIACPRCGQDEEFQITATATFDVTDEGTGDYQGVEWNADSPISCPVCGATGTVEEFQRGESYLLVDEEMGVFLGEAPGLAFWSALDSIDQTEAPSFTKADAQAIADLHEGRAVRLHRVPTPPKYHTAAELDSYGLEAYTHQLHANAAAGKTANA